MTDRPALDVATCTTLLDSVDAVIYVADMKTHELLFLNRKARETSGGSIGSLCWQTLQADREGPCTFCTNDRLLDEDGQPQAPYVWEFRNTRSGEWWECRDQAIRWHDGRLVRLEIATNISRRKAQEDEKKQLEDRYVQIFNNMGNGVAVYTAVDDGADFIITDFNRAAERIEQLDKTDILGRRVTEVFPGIAAFGLLDVLRSVWRNGQSRQHPQASYKDERIQGWRDNYVCKLPTGEVIAIYEDVTARKQAEQALRDREERLALVFESAELGFWDWFPQTGKVVFNQHWAGMLGYRLDELPPHVDTWSKLLHPDDVPGVIADLSAHLEGKTPIYRAEFRMRTKQGGWKWILDTGKVTQRDENRKPLRVTGIHLDVSERKLAEKALRDSEERYRGFFENSLVGVFISTPAGRYLKVNRAFAAMLGYDSPREVIDTTTDIARQHYINPADRDRFRQLLREHGSAADFIHKLRRKNGHELWLMSNSRRVKNAADNSIVYEGVIIDITEQKKTEDALRKSEENLLTTLNSIGDAVIAVDAGHRIVRLNPVAEKLTGWTSDEAVGQRLEQVFHIINAATGQRIETPVAQVLKSGEIVAVANHAVLLARDGAEAQIADSAAPIKDSRGRISGVVLVFRDVTEEYRIRDELYKMQQMESIGTLAGGIAHDFNNILAGIFGNIALARECSEHGHPSRKYLDQAEASANRAKNLTGKLLTFAKGGEPIRDHVGLAELIEDVARFDLSGSNVKLHFDRAENLWAAEIDKAQIQQVISNLVINAGQAMPNGGHLYIDIRNHAVPNDMSADLKPGRYLRVRIKDEGEGIPENNLARVFEPYFSTRTAGHGLGLATVYSIIHRHEGQIHIDSKPGAGTTFTFYLPATGKKPGEYEQTEQELEKTILARQKILLMDDEETLLNLTAEMLALMGAVTDKAKDGREALEKYRQALSDRRPYDLVIMDLTIPGGMGGKDAVKALLQLDPQAKVVVSSGYTDDPIMARHTEYGFKSVIVKPYSFSELKTAIEKALAR